jgi:hypothetical protein
MRSVAFAALLGLAACESNDLTVPVTVQWMDWPSEVSSGEPFRTRLVVWQPCAIIRDFRAAPTADESAVTFAPYFVTDKEPIYCLAGGVASEEFVDWAIDTAGMAPGLQADFDRTYEMRATATSCAVCVQVNSLPWATFGEVTVRPTPPQPSASRNAAGLVVGQRDSTGCTRIRPAGLPNASAAIVVENPPDTLAQWGAFVRGYIYQPAAAVCGEATVFHLVARN